MSLPPGTRIGAYEIQNLIGVGGMGEVYRARDTRLPRDVAVKVLPASYANDAGRVSRLEREARMLASLNHPHIAAIIGLEQDDGLTAIVLELVEGLTLADRLAEGPIPMAETLVIARQIVDALDAAHEKGVVHRDLKPANIKLRPDGIVKVLDFGLAKAATVPGATGEGPTLTADVTREGTILGTLPYMSPEQARGLPVDKRTDIWAFGCVLYEMLARERPFTGPTTTDVLAAIVGRDPEWTALPAIPTSVTRLLRRCLEKDPHLRLRDIGDARIEIDSADAEVPTAHTSGSSPRRWVRVGLLGLGCLLAGAGLAWMAADFLFRADPAPASLRFFVETIPDDRIFPAGGNSVGSMLALSPDGRRLVYVAQEGSEPRLFTRPLDRLDQLSSVPIGEPGAREPFFSPDGEWLGYRVGPALRRMPAQGGPPEKFADLPPGTASIKGISWSRDGTVLLGAGPRGLLRVSAGASVAEPLVTPTKDRVIWYPQALPGGRAVLYTESDGTPDRAELQLYDLSSRTSKLLRAGAAGRYLPSGHVVYVSGGTLWAIAFDVGRLETRGQAVPVVKGVRVDAEGGAVQVSVTESGALAYLPVTSSFQRTLVWVDADGKETSVGAPPRSYASPRVSPDGTRIAVTMKDGGEDVYVWDLSRGMLRQLTLDPTANSAVAWLDGTRLAFSAQVDGWAHVFLQSADGGDAARRLTTGLPAFPLGASRDGTVILVREFPPDGGWDIGVVPVDKPETRRTVERTKAHEHNPALSPDGRWLAYQSTKTGAQQIYVRPFPLSGAGEIAVTTEGGTQPVWARDGSELYYWTVAAGVVSIKAIRLTPGPPSTWTAPRTVVKGPYVSASSDTAYDVWDGRFLLMKNLLPEGARPRGEIVIAQDWLSELARLVPR